MSAGLAAWSHLRWRSISSTTRGGTAMRGSTPGKRMVVCGSARDGGAPTPAPPDPQRISPGRQAAFYGVAWSRGADARQPAIGDMAAGTLLVVRACGCTPADAAATRSG